MNRGQIEDWFGISFICWMLAIGAIGWIATVWWELPSKEPVIDFRVLSNRNFAICGALFVVFGIGLFGSTTLIPQMLQTLYGYRVIDAGLFLGPGAFVITLPPPIGAPPRSAAISFTRQICKWRPGPPFPKYASDSAR